MTAKPKGPFKPDEVPQVTFAEDELNLIVDYMNFISKETNGTVPLNKMKEYNRLTQGMVAHIKKVESHILEVRKVTNKKDK